MPPSAWWRTSSHELRTPLNAILGSIALLATVIGRSEAARPHLERLERNGRHLLAIVDDVLEMSRTESGQMIMSSGPRRVGAVVDEALADCEMLAASARLTITNAVSGGAADLPYSGDEGRVRQIVVNLLTNAIKFTEAGGLVTISGGTGDRSLARHLKDRVRGSTSGSRIPAVEFGPTTCRSSSNHFSSRRWRISVAAPGSAYRSAASSPAPWAGTCSPPVRSDADPDSPSGSPSLRPSPCRAEQFQPFHRGTRSHWSAGTSSPCSCRWPWPSGSQTDGLAGHDAGA